eukprot:m.153139 g.153139  ORF g.153139 m.153139 type:complete len:1178 (+) comp16932_c0_seq1:66-3599(+)
MTETCEVQRIVLLRRKPLLLRGDVLPFILGYLAIASCLATRHLSSAIGLYVAVGTVVLQVFTFLASFWSVEFCSHSLYSSVSRKNVLQATHVKVVPIADNTLRKAIAEICLSVKKARPSTPSDASLRDDVSQLEDFFEWELQPVESSTSASANAAEGTRLFEYCKLRYILQTTTESDDEPLFKAVEYPDMLNGQACLDSRGLSAEEVAARRQVFGSCRYEISIPQPRELLLQQMVAPIFVFQVTTMLLYMLDGMVVFCCVMLGMLVLIEHMLVKQRIKNFKESLDLREKPSLINVYRSNRWRRIPSDFLLPGDVCCITRSRDGQHVPCDLVVLNGSCVVNEAILTGEAVPQMKEPLCDLVSQGRALDASSMKSYVLYAGTEVVQATPPAKTSAGLRPPESACVCLVARTGFSTTQGGLLRSIMSMNEPATSNSREVWFLIGLLVVAAVAAAAYVWTRAIAQGRKNLRKLFIECLLIVASVVPPELPLQLSLAATNSLAAIQKLMITCTQPFRIPWAGKVDVCCFDKTGTLTSDEIMFEGCVGHDDQTEVTKPAELAEKFPDIAQCIASCHSLAFVDGTLLGDPMETAMLEALNWNFSKQEIASSRGGSRRLSARILQRFRFSSELKRMTTVVNVEEGGRRTHMVVTKGAPEVVLKLLKTPMPDKEKLYLSHARSGARVLALAYKPLPNVTKESEAREITREDAESDLIFLGLLIFRSPMKESSPKAVSVLRKSAHHLIIITGDSPMTACHVARELKIAKRKFLLLVHVSDSKSVWHADMEWHWEAITTEDAFPFTPKKQELRVLFQDWDLCLTGEALAFLSREHPECLPVIIPFVRVFARTSPAQKALIVHTLNDLGLTTLMCGDGSNDVGALKGADVGIALSPGKDDGKDSMDDPQTPALPPQRRPMNAAAEAVEGPVIPKLGDACIAAPFSSKKASVMSVCNVVRQGRCALTISMQMMQILVLNCLINSYMLSVLSIDGVKLSDTQMTVQGLCMAVCMMSVSKSKPLRKLSEERPRHTIFSPFMMISLFGQFAVHVAAVQFVVNAVKQLPGYKPVKYIPDSVFKMSHLNTAVFLAVTMCQVVTFAVNYRGKPFMNGIMENKNLLYVLGGTAAVIATSALGIDYFSGMLELTDMPPALASAVLQAMGADLVCAFLVDRIANFVFGLSKRSRIHKFW